MSQLDLPNIQGRILHAYRYPHVTYVFLRIDDAARARELLRETLGFMLTAEPWTQEPIHGLNVAFTYRGLEALGVSPASLGTFPREFREGAIARAAFLGDTGESSPAHWDGGLNTGDIHVMLSVSAHQRSDLEDGLALARLAIDRVGGMTEVSDQDAGLLPGGREHFGFVDRGFGQPIVEGSPEPGNPGQGVPLPNGGWRPLRAGEFLLGYLDEDGVMPSAPRPAVLSHNGTFLVYRKLHEHVALFRQWLATEGAKLPGGEELLAAKIVGRWRDGTPIELSPDRPDPALAQDDQRVNNFHYDSDPEGFICPRGAHIRRTNPRDAMRTSNRHRIIRREIPYGDPLPEGAPEDGQDRGIIFTAINSSISRQFEFIQTQWIDDGNIFHLDYEKDPLVGNHDGSYTDKMTIQGRPPCFIPSMPRFVTVRGSVYLFMPGMNGLRYLASGSASHYSG